MAIVECFRSIWASARGSKSVWISITRQCKLRISHNVKIILVRTISLALALF